MHHDREKKTRTITQHDCLVESRFNCVSTKMAAEAAEYGVAMSESQLSYFGGWFRLDFFIHSLTVS